MSVNLNEPRNDKAAIGFDDRFSGLRLQDMRDVRDFFVFDAKIAGEDLALFVHGNDSALADQNTHWSFGLINWVNVFKVAAKNFSDFSATSLTSS